MKKYELRYFKFKTRKFFDLNIVNMFARVRRYNKKISTNTFIFIILVMSNIIVIIVFTTNVFSFSSTRQRDRFRKIRE